MIQCQRVKAPKAVPIRFRLFRQDSVRQVCSNLIVHHKAEGAQVTAPDDSN